MNGVYTSSITFICSFGIHIFGKTERNRTGKQPFLVGRGWRAGFTFEIESLFRES